MKTTPGWLWGRAKAWIASLAEARAARGLAIAARLDLGARRSLLVVECGRRRFLVAVGAAAISSILEIGAGDADGGGEAGDGRASRPGRARARRFRRAPRPARAGLLPDLPRGGR